MQQMTSDYSLSKDPDALLVSAAIAGDRLAMNELLQVHAEWLHHFIAQRCPKNRNIDDISQEVMLAVFRRLHKFRMRCKFRTWLYRFATNYIAQLARVSKDGEISFTSLGVDSENSFCSLSSNLESVEYHLLHQEEKEKLIQGMLLCLDTRQRVSVLVSDFLGLDGRTGARVLAVSDENYRLILMRARNDLRSFVQEKCSLVDKSKPCHCARKTNALMKSGVVCKVSGQFKSDLFLCISEFVSKNCGAVEAAMIEECWAMVKNPAASHHMLSLQNLKLRIGIQAPH